MTDRPALGASIQAGLVKPARHIYDSDDRARSRDWALYVFFRILPEKNYRRSLALITNWLKTPADQAQMHYESAGSDGGSEPAAPLADPAQGGGADMPFEFEPMSPVSYDEIAAHLENASMYLRDTFGNHEESAIGLDPNQPSAFLAWLNLIVDNRPGAFLEIIRGLADDTSAEQSAESTERQPILVDLFRSVLGLEPQGDLETERSPLREFITEQGQLNRELILELVSDLPARLTDTAEIEALINLYADNQSDPNDPCCSRAVDDGLTGVLLQELIRQVTPALLSSAANTDLPTPARSEADNQHVLRDATPFDAQSLSISFSHHGLTALHLNQETLDSFPEAFRDGMAARAERLGDTGDSAPEYWHGELGQKSIDGFFTGGFRADRATEKAWDIVRDEIEDFNLRTERGRKLRERIGGLFRLFGLEIVHVELGERAYAPDADRQTERHNPPLEHFGFRDGISQPVVDLGLEQTDLGGGVPRRDRTWAPVAPGEIFLGRRDEDERRVLTPINSDLRDNGTYIVFRKLEQDVLEFHNYFKRLHPDDSAKQALTKAQFVGRWPNGADLVRSPYDDKKKPHESQINNFLYEADDPLGEKCPLGAHVRRVNPRDIGGRSDSKRHRILRRSIPYGGRLILEDHSGDHRPRGLIFIAANSRIEMQFEILQGKWLNGGEFLGQAGLGVCPLTGNHDDTRDDRFLAPGAAAPITGIPNFVTMRGGDYFFLPSMEALRKIAAGDMFEPNLGDASPTTFERPPMAAITTPDLFDPDRIETYAKIILSGRADSVTLNVPDVFSGVTSLTSGPGKQVYEDDKQGDPLTFVAKFDDVRHVLGAAPLESEEPTPKKSPFSVRHYHSWGTAMAPGTNYISATDSHWAPKTRTHLHKILAKASKQLVQQKPFSQRIKEICQKSHEKTLLRTAQSGRIDLVRDIAADACYDIMQEIYGFGGPDHITELAAAMPFARQHIGQIYPEWLDQIERQAPENPGLTTLQLWAVLQMIGLVGNVRYSNLLTRIARQASGELRNHIRGEVDRAFMRTVDTPNNMIEAFAKSAHAEKLSPTEMAQRKTDVASILAEITGFLMGGVPSVFGEIMVALMDARLDVSRLVPRLKQDKPYLDDGDDPDKYHDSGLHHLIYETLRLNPSPKLIFRYCEKSHTNPVTGTEFRAGEWIACIMRGANKDPRHFTDGDRLSLYPWAEGPKRPKNLVTAFGPFEGMRPCWGTYQGLDIMSHCLEAVAELEGLRRVAGPTGEAKDIVTILIGLRAQFAPFKSSHRAS